jgi:hypothetical protein
MRMIVCLLLAGLLATGAELMAFGVPEAAAQDSQETVKVSPKRQGGSNTCCGTQGCSICCPVGRTAVCNAATFFLPASCTCQ